MKWTQGESETYGNGVEVSRFVNDGGLRRGNAAALPQLRVNIWLISAYDKDLIEAWLGHQETKRMTRGR